MMITLAKAPSLHCSCQHISVQTKNPLVWFAVLGVLAVALYALQLWLTLPTHLSAPHEKGRCPEDPTEQCREALRLGAKWRLIILPIIFFLINFSFGALLAFSVTDPKSLVVAQQKSILDAFIYIDGGLYTVENFLARLNRGGTYIMMDPLAAEEMQHRHVMIKTATLHGDIRLRDVIDRVLIPTAQTRAMDLRCYGKNCLDYVIQGEREMLSSHTILRSPKRPIKKSTRQDGPRA
jgi:hypothetical protein